MSRHAWQPTSRRRAGRGRGRRRVRPSSVSATLARPNRRDRRPARLVRAAEAARDDAGGVHRPDRPAGRARTPASGARVRRRALHRGRRRRLRRDQHVVRPRHRRPDAPHAQSADPAGPHRARRGAGLRRHPRRRLGDHDGARHQRRRRRAAGAVDRLLRLRLYDLAETAHAAEHRHRRRRRRLPRRDRLGRGHRLGRPACR